VISRPDRVQVWAAQLAANDFPPVCALTGAPAETWRKFRFRSSPPWAYLLGAMVAALVAEKASGFLPLTRSSSRLVGLALWIPVWLMFGAVGLWLLVAIAAVANVDASDPNAGGVGFVFVCLGILLLVSGIIGRLVVYPLISPRARITRPPGYYDKLVELRNVHPSFVAAVMQRQQAPAQPTVPLPPGSN
jgi:Na+-transporting methylmalonyl-CoA/oxaloacetate decarboxylase gamma subunit